MFDWENYCFLVSGGSRGLGRELVLKLSAKGATVGVIARSEEALRSLRSQNERIHVFPGSITDEKLVSKAIEELQNTDKQFYGFIHCAANLALGSVSNYSVEDFEDVVLTQLKGAFLLAKNSYESLVHSNEGVMIFIGSTLSHDSTIDSSLYVMAKHGLEGFAKALNDDLFGTNVRVIMLCPDDLDTSFIPGGPPHPSRAISVSELSELILELIPPKGNLHVFHVEFRGLPKK